MDKNLYNYRIELVRVIDSNTIVANIDLGFDIVKRNASIQLLEVDEQTEKYTLEEYKQILINEIEGKQLTIRSKQLDGFGRAEAVLYVLEEGLMFSVNEEMNQK